ncbi:unnamed protein product [Symbiodinium natans]|uniref:THH1/TOM1/TOM3 domain-containing protein n=1 Tax=Symbiodinium natans TaxID=878477 RepID=A0A812IX93_9DINO|nr:unnamed protein product [Symbiodinium natans]
MAAGNNDPQENALSHVFGQQSVCVAMDFPGWSQAALAAFLLSGFIDGWVVIQVYRHCVSTWSEAGASKASCRMLAGFFTFVVLCLNSFWLVYFWNPVDNHSPATVVAHTIPYLCLQVGYFLFVAFLLAALRPTSVGTCRKVSWYVLLSIYFLLKVANICVTLWTFSELLEEGVQLGGQSSHKGPKVRFAATRVLEPGAILALALLLLLHPFQPSGPSPVTPEGRPDKDAGLEAA